MSEAPPPPPPAWHMLQTLSQLGYAPATLSMARLFLGRRAPPAASSSSPTQPPASPFGGPATRWLLAELDHVVRCAAAEVPGGGLKDMIDWAPIRDTTGGKGRSSASSSPPPSAGSPSAARPWQSWPSSPAERADAFTLQGLLLLLGWDGGKRMAAGPGMTMDAGRGVATGTAGAGPPLVVSRKAAARARKWFEAAAAAAAASEGLSARAPQAASDHAPPSLPFTFFASQQAGLAICAAAEAAAAAAGGDGGAGPMLAAAAESLLASPFATPGPPPSLATGAAAAVLARELLHRSRELQQQQQQQQGPGATTSGSDPAPPPPSPRQQPAASDHLLADRLLTHAAERLGDPAACRLLGGRAWAAAEEARGQGSKAVEEDQLLLAREWFALAEGRLEPEGG